MSGAVRRTRVLVVDDHPIRRGLSGLLGSVADADVVGVAADADEAVGRVQEGGVDVVLMDLNLPTISGVEATGRITELPDAPAVLVLTMVDDEDTLVSVLRAGARGYVLQGATGEQIAAAVRAVAGAASSSAPASQPRCSPSPPSARNAPWAPTG